MRYAKCLLVAFAVSQRSGGQVPVITLKPPQLRHDSSFSGIRSARVLPDDRVLVSEFDTRRLLILDFRSQAVRQIGRRGQGPGEYTVTPALFALGMDSTLATIRTQRRWLVLSGDRIVATVPQTDSLLVKTRGSIVGANRTHFLFTRDLSPRPDGIVDSADVFLISRSSGRVEQIARIRIAATRIGVSKDNQGRTLETSDAVGVRSSESAVLFDDGWVAIVRLDPARIDWRQPGGQMVLGSLERSPVRLEGAFATSDGRVLAYQMRDADADYRRYRLIDRAGRVQGEIRLRTGQRILAVSSKWVLLLSTDDDGLQHLALLPWP